MRIRNRSLMKNPAVLAVVIVVALAMLYHGMNRIGIIDLAKLANREDFSEPRTFTSERVNLSDAVDMAGSYLAEMCLEDGEFEYRRNLNPVHDPAPRYNMLRHAGAIYALGQYHARTGDTAAREAILRATGFLTEVGIAPVPGHADSLLAVWTREEIVHQNKDMQAKLGGAGLSLVALVPVHEMAPDAVPLETLRGLARFILWMQKPDGSFYSKYYADDGRDDSWTSLYYPGEAALGLMTLYEIDPDPRWLRGAASAMQYLSLIRAPQQIVEPDHWALIATGGILKHHADLPDLPPDWLFINHAKQIVQSMLAGHQNWGIPRESPFHGSFMVDGRTTPTATRLEGLIAAMPYIPPEERDLRQKMGKAISDGTGFLLRAMIRDGAHAGAVPRALTQLDAKHPAHSSDFNRRATEVRIDYVQHALSAFIGYLALSGDDLIITT